MLFEKTGGHLVCRFKTTARSLDRRSGYGIIHSIALVIRGSNQMLSEWNPKKTLFGPLYHTDSLYVKHKILADVAKKQQKTSVERLTTFGIFSRNLGNALTVTWFSYPATMVANNSRLDPFCCFHTTFA